MSAVLSALLVASLAGTGRAELPSPSFMPGFPLLAGNQVILMWTPVPGAVKYFVFLNGEKVAESASFQFTLAAPEKSGSHQLAVAGVDAEGKAGKQSSPGTVKIIIIQPPGGLSTMAATDSVGIRWEKAEGAMIYNVYRSETEGGEKKLVLSTQDTVARDKEVQKLKLYYYWITSKDATGRESGFAKPITGKTEAVAEAVKGEVYTLTPIRTEYEILNVSQPLVGPLDFAYSKGKFYLLENARKKILIMNPDGQVEDSFGEEGWLDGQFVAPRGIAVGNGKIVVTDSNRGVVLVFDQATKEFVREFEIPKKDKEKEKTQAPSSLAFTPRGTLLIIESQAGRLVEMDIDGKYIRSLDEKNVTPVFKLGSFGSPAYVRVDTEGRVYVSDAPYGKVHVLDKDLKPLFGVGGDKGVGSMVDVGKVAVDEKRGIVYVSDPMLATVQGFGIANGKYQFSLFGREGKILKDYVPQWEIGSPRVLAMDDAGNLWILMVANRQVARFTKYLDPLPAPAPSK